MRVQQMQQIAIPFWFARVRLLMAGKMKSKIQKPDEYSCIFKDLRCSNLLEYTTATKSGAFG